MATTFLEPGTDATQDLSLWNNVIASSGTIASASDQSHTGSRSLKATTASTVASCHADSPDGVLADAGSRFSVWVRLSAIPVTFKTIFLSMMTAAGDDTPILGLAISTAGKILVFSEGPGTLATGTTTISAATWTRLSGGYVITATNNWSFKVYINGTLEFSLTQTAGTLGGTGTSDLTPGMYPDGSAGFTNTENGLSIWFDDIYCDNSNALTDPGDIRVTAKRPIANGTTNGFTTQIGAGGSGYGSGHAPQVNEQPLSQTNGWSMVGAGAAVTEEYSVEGVAVGDVDLTGLTLYDWTGWIFAKSLSSETASLIVGGSTSNAALTSTPAAFFQAKGSTTYPAGNTDVGLITTTALTTVSLYECGVIVAYNPTPPAIVFVPHQTYMAGILTQ